MPCILHFTLLFASLSDSIFLKNWILLLSIHCTCSECKSCDWTPLLLETHNRFIKLKVVKDHLAALQPNTNYINSRSLQNNKNSQ